MRSQNMSVRESDEPAYFAGISHSETCWYFQNGTLLLGRRQICLHGKAAVPSIHLGLQDEGLPQQVLNGTSATLTPAVRQQEIG